MDMSRRGLDLIVKGIHVMMGFIRKTEAKTTTCLTKRITSITLILTRLIKLDFSLRITK